jgi:hypothetical protein
MRYLTILVLGLAVIGVAAAPLTPAHAQGGWTESGSTVHLTTNGDRVGIGTTTPAVKLHVNGGVRVEGGLSTNVISSRSGSDLRLRAGTMEGLRLEQTTVSPNIIGGHRINEVVEGVQGATIGGGGDPAGPDGQNVVTDDFGTVGGGFGNQAGDAGTTDDAYGATVSGGVFNRAQALSSTVGGGLLNEATGMQSTVGGGIRNVASGLSSTVPGGSGGKATHAGSFVWADAAGPDFASQAANQFRARSTGGAQFVSAVNSAGTATAGVALAAGGGSWASISDRSLKENFAAVDGGEILRRLSAVSITRWNLKAQNPAIKHLGPMAQDFYAAFGLGEDERYINSADIDGIALVSIQALHQLVTTLEQKATAVDRKAADLERKMAEVERIATGLEELRARLTRFERAAEVR